MSVNIPVGRHRYAIIDEDDALIVSEYSWHAVKPNNNKSWYAVRHVSDKEIAASKHILMHRQILGVDDPAIEIDHKDGNGLNNTKDNLRTCTKSQNCANRGLRSDNLSGFKGVSWAYGKWRTRITVEQKIIHIGRYSDIIEAAEAYNIAAVKYFGEFANLNEIPS